MYNVNDELSPRLILEIIQSFQVKERPKMKKWEDYYLGKQAIMNKHYDDPAKPCNVVLSNYCKDIAQIYQGYITGVPISYQSDEKNIERVIDVMDYNDVHREDSSLLRDALIYGRAFEVQWVDRDGQQRFKKLSPLETIPVYDNTLEQELKAVIRFYTIKEGNENSAVNVIEVYEADRIRRFRSTLGFSSIEPLEEEPHYYGQVPVSVFSLNEEEVSIFEGIISLQDAYNNLMSSEVDDFEAFTDAYLVLKNCMLEKEDLASMRQNRILMLDEGAEAEYLTKNINDTTIENMLNRLNDAIYNKAKAPDFNDEKFMSASGIAMRYKLSGFIFVCGNIIANMKQALQKRIELISAILSLTDELTIWRSVDIIFTPNLPVDMVEEAQKANMLKGIVSDETLLSQLSFVKDPKEEMERLEAQKQKEITIYDYLPAKETE